MARDHVMNDHPEGELITVEDQVIRQKGPARLGGTLYGVQVRSLVDRPLK